MLFDTTSTRERFELARAFEWSYEEVRRLEEKAVGAIFDDSAKAWLLKRIQQA